MNIYATYFLSMLSCFDRHYLLDVVYKKGGETTGYFKYGETFHSAGMLLKTGSKQLNKPQEVPETDQSH